MKKLYVSLGLIMLASILCTACGLKNDLYLPEENQSAMQLIEPTEDFGLEMIVADNGDI